MLNKCYGCIYAEYEDISMGAYYDVCYFYRGDMEKMLSEPRKQSTCENKITYAEVQDLKQRANNND